MKYRRGINIFQLNVKKWKGLSGMTWYFDDTAPVVWLPAVLSNNTVLPSSNLYWIIPPPLFFVVPTVCLAVPKQIVTAGNYNALTSLFSPSLVTTHIVVDITRLKNNNLNRIMWWDKFIFFLSKADLVWALMEPLKANDSPRTTFSNISLKQHHFTSYWFVTVDLYIYSPIRLHGVVLN
jgi:hypothetical protein